MRRFRWLPLLLLLVVWLVIGAVGGPYAGKLGEVQTNDATTFLPSTAESTEVAAIDRTFAEDPSTPAVLVVARDGGLTDADRAWLTKVTADLPDGSPVVRSQDGAAAEVVVPLTGEQDKVADRVAALRSRLDQGRPDGLRAYVTGPAGFAADLVKAFAGIDGVLLLVALLVVLVILLVVYRSPILPFAVLLSAVFALGLASAVVYQLAAHGVITLNGQSQGILSILVVGAATDYALLFTSRFREELRRHESRYEALRVAWRQSVGPILASGATVILALLCLLASDLNSTQSLGPVAALGIAGALLSALTFLPAVLGLLGRGAFWPARPRFGSEHPEHSGLWGRIADGVVRRPRPLWAGTALLLVVLAAFASTFAAHGTAQTDVFLHSQPSVTGQRLVAAHFPGGSGSPALVVGPADRVGDLVDTAEKVDGVASAMPVTDPSSGRPRVVDGRTEVQVVLSDTPDSDGAIATVKRLRTAEHRAVPDALVGGPTATTLDTRDTARRDLRVVIPLVLLVILIVLGLVLRAVAAAVVLLLTVVLSYAATLGVSALVFNHLFGFPGADPSVPLFGFVFLVALGVDYNIFLMTRAREEVLRSDPHTGIKRALAATGGVITSAGVVLAATFAALTVIPLLFLSQIAFIVAFGVLLDTLVVRSLLVPAVATDLGRRLWWPTRVPCAEGAAPAGRTG
ncbi:MAG: MMPL family transporter [Marmoricola sp.]